MNLEVISNPSKSGHILIVDDEPNVRAPLAHALSLEGYRITEAKSGQEALNLLAQASYNLMILDMYMPGIGGIEVMQLARQRYPSLPIIILTGRATLESAITAVKVHAADYLLKPVGMRKLVATVREALERQARDRREQDLLAVIGHAFDELRAQTPAKHEQPKQTSCDDVLVLGPLKVERQKRLVVINDSSPRQAELSKGEEAILVCLMEHANQVLSCRRLAYLGLGYQHEDEYEAQRLIRPYISRLRKKIELSAKEPAFIRTVRGRGYLLSLS